MIKPLYFFLFSLFFINISYGIGDDSGPSSSNCPRYESCGDNLTIKYPFWRTDNYTASNQYCGYPNFGLSCSDGKTTLRLPADYTFHVKDINYTNHSITLVDIDLGRNQNCPRPRHNLTLETLPLHYSKSDLTLSFYFNCTGNPFPWLHKPPIECLRFEGKQSFVNVLAGNDSEQVNWSGICEENVRVMVSSAHVSINDLNIFTEFGWAMGQGFMLDWRTARECGACEASEGNCGSSKSEKDFLCFCKDGKVRSEHCGGFEMGFFMNWTAVDNCNTCVTSSGCCGLENNEFICFCNDQPHSKSRGHGNNLKMRRKIIIFIGAAFGSIGILFICIILYSRKKASSIAPPIYLKKKHNPDLEAFIRNRGPLAVKRYNFADIKKMTNFFQDKLGQGGYGIVYKGKLTNGRLVAVKVLKASKGNAEEFINEVASISRTSHVNIVSLLGFCFERDKRVLVFDFMPNGSLEKFINHENSLQASQQLGWEKLYQIVVGVARGLEYLHRGCNTRIVHFDIKPHNILLDADFFPKISDFGLAKPCTRKESTVSLSEARGTIGYMAPEVFSRNFGQVSHKSDVYSYGMMVLEMVGGRKNHEAEINSSSEEYFPQWIYKRLEIDNEFELIGAATAEETEIVRKITIVGLWCIQTNPSDRPSMSKVIEMLEGPIGALKIPPRPFLSSPPRLLSYSSTTSLT